MSDASKFAKKHGWEKIPTKDPYLESWIKPGKRINYWECTGTVGTCIDHPKQGRTQLFRKYVYGEQLEAIFKNPRVHTGKGYK